MHNLFCYVVLLSICNILRHEHLPQGYNAFIALQKRLAKFEDTLSTSPEDSTALEVSLQFVACNDMVHDVIVLIFTQKSPSFEF